MKLTPKQIQDNWSIFLNNIEVYITSDRKEKLLNFYKKYEERIILMPASHKKEYHNAFPGGYVEHVNRVVAASLKIYDVWCEFEMDKSTFSIEELVFSAINHDLGKMPEQKPRTCLPFILHQADLMAARIEFEREWLPKLKGEQGSVDKLKKNYTLGTTPNSSKKMSTKVKALGSIESNGLKTMLENL